MSKRKPTILFVGPLPPHSGGTAVACAQLLTGLAEIGFSILAAAPRYPNDPRRDEFADRHAEIAVSRFALPQADIDPHTVISETAADKRVYRAQQMQQVLQTLSTLIAKHRPDVILIGRESFVWGIPDVARHHGIPCILRVGDLVMSILRGTYQTDMAKAILEEIRKVDRVVCVAKHQVTALERLGLHNAVTIWNAVDTDQFRPRERCPALLKQLHIDEGDLVAAHVSNLKPTKRPLDLVESAEIALRQESRLIYLIVGDGPDRAAVEAACRECNIADRFRFVGWVDYPRVPDYLHLADMVIMPSVREGLARAYLETQACGRVLLASDIAAAREIIADGETGILFQQGDIGELATKTLMIAASKKLRTEIGCKARAWAVQHHSFKKALVAHADAIERVIASRRS